MDVALLRNYVSEGLSQRKIAGKLGVSQATIKHWLNKLGLKTQYNPAKVTDGSKLCPNCREEKSIEEFYIYAGRVGSWCKSCNIKSTIDRQRDFKQLCVDYKGGQCCKCGYNRYIGALDFHHSDPSEKDFEISKYKLNKFDWKVKEELDKCILVCSNCHREIHGTVAQLVEQETSS